MSSCSQGQNLETFNNGSKLSGEHDNIQYLRDHSRKGEIKENGKIYEFLIDYIIGELLVKPEYKEFLIDKRLLRKFNSVLCQNGHTVISDSLSNGKQCIIDIKAKSFKISDQKIKMDENGNLIEINGNYPYGEVYGIKNRHVEYISTVSIKIDGVAMKYDINTLVGLYDPNFCYFNDWTRMIEAYEHDNRIYIYIQGGNAANTYCSKLIFDHKNFITSIVVDYYYLSVTGSFSSFTYSGF